MDSDDYAEIPGMSFVVIYVKLKDLKMEEKDGTQQWNIILSLTR